MHVIVAIWGVSFYTYLPLKPISIILKINIDKVPSKYINFFSQNVLCYENSFL